MNEQIPPQIEQLQRNLNDKERVVISPENMPQPLIEVGERLGLITDTWNPIELLDASKESLAIGKAEVFKVS